MRSGISIVKKCYGLTGGSYLEWDFPHKEVLDAEKLFIDRG